MAGRLLVVGAGMAAAYLLEELARRDHDYDITVIGDESRACYNRVLLSGLLAGEVDEADLNMLPERGAARVITGVRITAIDSRSRCVQCNDGRRLVYDQLVIATGASVAMPDLDIRHTGNLRVVRTVADVQHLRSLPAGGRAVVVGGGLLGLEAAHGLNELGFSTAVLHRNPVLMNRQLDAEGGACLRTMLEARGLTIRSGVSPTALHYGANDLLTAVEVDDGGAIDCDILVMATGIQAQTGLAASGELDCERGIVVDAHLRTSSAGVYALGECCQFEGRTFGLVAPVREQAEVLVRTLCGEAGPAFRISDWPVQLKISGIDIFRAGDIDGAAQQIVVRDPGRGVYRRLAIRDDRLIGAVLVGDISGSTWYADLIREQQDIAALRSRLMFSRDATAALRSTSKTGVKGETA